MTGTGLTLSGLALSLAIFYANFRPWWKGTRDPKAAIPFGQGFGIGALGTICTGGILGWLAGCSSRIANTGGDKAVRGTTGTGGSGAVTHGDLGQLTPEGAVIVFLLTVGVVLAWRAAGKTDKKRMFGGTFCGSTLCLTAGVANALNWLPDLVNQLGQVLRTAAEGAGLL